MVRENGVNVTIDLKKLEDSVFLVIILQITTFDPNYNFCIKNINIFNNWVLKCF